MPAKLQSFEALIRTRYAHWLDRRVPPRREITLVQNNIFIYPNVQFIYFFSVIMMLWIAATNYENNLSFGLSFLLLSVFLVCIIYTFNNLAGLTITVVGSDPVFCEEYADVALLLTTAEGKDRDAINIAWEKDHSVQVGLLDTTQQRVRVPVKATKRGLFNPGRVTIDTVYPLGIVRSVSYLDLDIKILVYPKPQRLADLLAMESESGDGEKISVRRGSSEFSHLDDYQSGMSLKQVAWKQYAKGLGLQVKEYADYAEKYLWLDWSAFPALGTEEKLSTLCYWALEIEKSGEPYGLRIPGAVIEPSQGSMHQQKVLTDLAMFGE